MKKTKLPEGWHEIELGNKEYFEIQPSGIDKFEGEKDYLSTESIQGTDIEKIECKITYKDRPSRANMQPALNSVWFAKMQATLKVYSFTQANKGEINGFILSTGFAGIRVEDSKVDPFYLRHFLKSKEFNRIKDSNCSGATQKAIGNEKLSKIKILLPPLSVQKKIVKLLDRAEQAKIKREKADQLTRDYLDFTFHKLFGNLGKNDKKWDLRRFGDCLQAIESGWSPVCEGVRRDNEKQYAVLKLSSVTYGNFNPEENKLLLIDNEMNNLIEVKEGDLLFTRKNTRELVGATAYVFERTSKLLLPDTIFKLVLKKDILLPQYVWKLFLNSHFKKKVKNLANGSAGSMPNISKDKLRKLEIPLPPISIQQKFAKIVEQVEKLKEKQQKSKEKIDEIFNSLMQKAFRGELVK